MHLQLFPANKRHNALHNNIMNYRQYYLKDVGMGGVYIVFGHYPCPVCISTLLQLVWVVFGIVSYLHLFHYYIHGTILTVIGFWEKLRTLIITQLTASVWFSNTWRHSSVWRLHTLAQLSPEPDTSKSSIEMQGILLQHKNICSVGRYSFNNRDDSEVIQTQVVTVRPDHV